MLSKDAQRLPLKLKTDPICPGLDKDGERENVGALDPDVNAPGFVQGIQFALWSAKSKDSPPAYDKLILIREVPSSLWCNLLTHSSVKTAP